MEFNSGFKGLIEAHPESNTDSMISHTLAI